MSRLLKKSVVITGAATGLGRVAAELFANQGAHVTIADLANGEEAVAAIQQQGGTASFVECNVTNEDSVKAAIDHAVNTYGGLHVLYNNAGVSLADDGDPESTDVDVWERTLAVNVTGVALGCKYAIPAMKATLAQDGPAPANPNIGRSASIINVASFVAHLGAATPQIAYTASKGAVLSMTREIAVIYAREGIRANALCPGPVLTPLLAKYFEDEVAKQRRLVHIPMGRFGEAEEIANGALFLASDESSFMTGQSLLVDGGITAAYTTPE